MALLPPPSTLRPQISAESLPPAYSTIEPDPWAGAGAGTAVAASGAGSSSAPTLTVTLPLTAPSRPPPPPPIPDTRINWNTYEASTGTVSGSASPPDGSPYGYTEGRTLSDEEIPMNPSPAAQTAPVQSPYDVSTSESSFTGIGPSNPWSTGPVTTGAAATTAAVAATAMPSVYDGGASSAYGRPYWDSGNSSSNVYSPGSTPGTPRLPQTTSTSNPNTTTTQPKPKSPPKPKSRDPTPFGNLPTWLLTLFILLPCAALSGLAWTLFASFAAAVPTQANTTGLTLRILSYIAFVSLGLSFLFFAMNVFGDLCCLLPDSTVYADGTERKKRRRAPPVWFVDFKLSMGVIMVCVFIGILVPYSWLSGQPSFLSTSCNTTPVLQEQFCTKAKAVLGLGSTAGFGWLFFMVYCVWQRKWAILEGSKMEAARRGI